MYVVRSPTSSLCANLLTLLHLSSFPSAPAQSVVGEEEMENGKNICLVCQADQLTDEHGNVSNCTNTAAPVSLFFVSAAYCHLLIISDMIGDCPCNRCGM